MTLQRAAAQRGRRAEGAAEPRAGRRSAGTLPGGRDDREGRSFAERGRRQRRLPAADAGAAERLEKGQARLAAGADDRVVGLPSFRTRALELRSTGIPADFGRQGPTCPSRRCAGGGFLRRHHADGRRTENDHEQHRQEEQDHRHGELGRQPGGLLLGLRHAHIAVFLRHHAQRLGERRAVALGLLQSHADRLHAVEIGAFGEVLVGGLAVLQIGQFGGGQRQLFRQRDRLRADFRADPLERRLDRHARIRRRSAADRAHPGMRA